MIQKSYSLKNHNTFGVDVKADLFFTFNNIEDLMAFSIGHINANTDIFILGGGSNVLFRDNINKLILHSKIKSIETVKEEKDSILIKVGSGVVWDDFVKFCVDKKYYGIENLSLIPGNVGAAPVQNIGAYGTEINNYIVEVNAYDITNNKQLNLNNEDCQFSYRNSIFKTKDFEKVIITHVVFKLFKTAPHRFKIRKLRGNALQKRISFTTSVIKEIYKAGRTLKINFRRMSLSVDYRYLKDVLENTGLMSITKVRQTIINKRNSKIPIPSQVGNAGSFFKNPIIPKEQSEQIKNKYPKVIIYPLNDNEVKISAGWMIKETGWLDKSYERVGLYKDQALIIINKDNATGNEIYDFSQQIVNTVFEKFNIKLEREVVVV